MKSKWIVVSVLIVALICVCMSSLFATWQGVKMAQSTGVHFNLANWSVEQVNAEAKDEKSLKVNGPASLSLETMRLSWSGLSQ